MRVLVLVWLAAILFMAAGWIMNIVEIAQTVDVPITGLFILRCIGVVMPPLGGVLGWV